MKPKNLLLLCLAVLMLSLTGCASDNATHYPTLKQTQTRVAWPMTRFRNAVAQFKPITQEEQERVNKAYTAYELSFNEALEAAHGNYHAPTPSDVKTRANELVRILNAIPLQGSVIQ